MAKSIKPLGWTWTIQWGNPYTQPPHGRPRVRLQVTRPQTSAFPNPPVIDRAMEIIGFGSGWCVSCGPIMPEPKRLSPEAKGKLRTSNLRRRIEKKAPLLASDLVQIELAKDPDYYNGRK